MTPADWANTGSRNFSKRFDPPRLCGIPSQPAPTAQIARIISGIVIDFGDSWMWCSTSCDMRGLPQNVRYISRNM